MFGRKIFDPGLQQILGLGAGASSVIKSIQYVTSSILTSNSSRNVTITAVDTANTILLCMFTAGGGSQPDSTWKYTAHLSSSTNIQLTRSNSSASAPDPCGIFVVEFQPGVIRSVQSGEKDLGNSASGTVTITSVNTAKSVALYLGHRGKATDGSSNRGAIVALTDATTVTITIDDSDTNTYVRWMVVDFY